MVHLPARLVHTFSVLQYADRDSEAEREETKSKSLHCFSLFCLRRSEKGDSILTWSTHTKRASSPTGFPDNFRKAVFILDSDCDTIWRRFASFVPCMPFSSMCLIHVYTRFPGSSDKLPDCIQIEARLLYLVLPPRIPLVSAIGYHSG